MAVQPYSATAPIKSLAGTAASPGITFTGGDTDTGIYSPADNQVGITTGGTSKLIIDENGSLQVVGGTKDNPAIYFDGGTGIYSPGADQVAISTNGTGRLFVDASGNVGIGITNPSEILDVNGKGLFDQLKVNTNFVTTATDIELTSNAVIRSVDSIRNVVNTGGFFGWNIGGTDASAGTSGSSEVARIDSSGRLLVGTSSQSGGSLLQVNDDRIRIASSKTPASASDTGTAGEICWDSSYIYVCTATDTWKRAALSTW